MADSPSHKFGQALGEFVESVIQPELDAVCRQHGLYLDHRLKARACRKGRKTTWSDSYGNSHDLDFIIEKGASDSAFGEPVGFIELAWRRYTKHSRNKAQEIQGAILPLKERYKANNPFLGVVLAGEFTEGARGQLQSLGFQVLYLPYESLVASFGKHGVDITFEEKTPNEECTNKLHQFQSISPRKFERIRSHLLSSQADSLASFMDALHARFRRRVIKVAVIPLYGRYNEFGSIESAIEFLDQHLVYEGSGDFKHYEILVEFSNGDKVNATFQSKDSVKDFLAFVSRQ